MDVTRTIMSFLGHLHPEDSDFGNQHDIPMILLGALGPALCFWYHYAFSGIEIETRCDRKESIGENFLRLLKLGKKPSDLETETMHVSLIMYAEHGFNASAFAARVSASTLSDIYSCMTTGVSTLKGKLHGGANEEAMRYLGKLKSIQEADEFLNNAFTKKGKVMGFGHKVYKNGDPRHYIIKKYSEKLSYTPTGNRILYQVSDHLENRMIKEKKIYPNLDFFSSSTYHQMGIPNMLFTPIFVISRLTGWCAHVYEQRANNSLIRPKAKYIGPDPRKVKDFMPKL